MTADDFKAWRAEMGLSQRGAAEALDLSRGTIENYERGHRIGGQPSPIPLTVALACTALAEGLAPWPQGQIRRNQPR